MVFTIIALYLLGILTLLIYTIFYYVKGEGNSYQCKGFIDYVQNIIKKK